MGWGDQDDGADAHCVHCRCPVYFEVGFGRTQCPDCFIRGFEDVLNNLEKDIRKIVT